MNGSDVWFESAMPHIRVAVMQRGVHYYLINCALFCLTIPFVAPVPLHTDVQYPIFMISALLIVADIYRGSFRLSLHELYFLWVALISFVYVNPFLDVQYDVVKRVGLLFAFLVYYSFSRYSHLINVRYFLVGVWLNMVAVVAHLLSPEMFSTLAGYIVRTIKISQISSSRGVSGFAAEPGFLGAMSIVFLLLSYHFLRIGKMTHFQFQSTVLVSLVMLLATSSGTASLMLLVLLVLVFLLSQIKLSVKLLFFIGVGLLIYFYVYMLGLGGRGVYVMQKLLEDPVHVFFVDQSVALRGIAVSIGIESIIQGNLLGHGVGSLGIVSPELIQGTELGRLFQRVEASAGGLLSSFAQYTVELGIWFLALIFWLYWRGKRLRYVAIIRVMTLFFLVASFSILFPPLWVLLALTDKRQLICGREGCK